MLLTAVTVMPAVAQTNVGYQLEEVIVTAEKREVNLQKVSTSIQVRDGDELRKEGKKRIDEIMQGTVGIQMQDGPVGATFFVRGVDSGGDTSVTTVPILVDGVAQTRTESVRGGTLDLARAEVMRGPQSTTLGANALSGAISLVSNNPVFEYEASGTLEVGNYHKQSLEGVLNVPISENQAVRIAYAADKRDGYISNGAGDSDFVNARLKYRWKPTDDLDIVGTFYHQLIGGNGVQQRTLMAFGRYIPYVAGPASVSGTSAQRFNLTFPAGSCAQNAGARTSAVGAVNRVVGNLVANQTLIGCPVSFIPYDDGTDFRSRDNAWDDGLPADIWSNSPFRHTNVDQASIEVNWTTDMGTVTFLPSYQKAHFTATESPRGNFWMANDDYQRTKIVDLRMNSNAGGKFVWQTGLYYSGDAKESMAINSSYPGRVVAGGVAGNCGAIGGTFPTANCWTYQFAPVTNRVGRSVYANAEFSPLETVRLIGGVRYNDDYARLVRYSAVDGTAIGPNPVGIPASPTSALRLGLNTQTVVNNISANWNHTTYRTGLEWDVTPDTMVYGVYSTGYTPGNLDTMQTTPQPKVTLSQVTAGWKSQLLDNRLQFNGEAFLTTFKNRQVDGTVTGYGSGIGGYSGPATTDFCAAGGMASATNAVNYDTQTFAPCLILAAPIVPKFLSKGVDVDLTWLLSANDRLTLTGEYLSAAYDTRPEIVGAPSLDLAFINGLITTTPPPVGQPSPSTAARQELIDSANQQLDAFVGATLQNSPKFSATLEYQHSFVFAGGSRLTPRLSGQYKTKYWSLGTGGVNGFPGVNVVLDAANRPDRPQYYLAWQQAYTKWDFLTSWDNADGRFSVTGYVRNLTDEIVMVGYTYPTVSLDNPRTWGATISARF
jgi:iron complex outermembrane receptor protein